MLGIWSQALMIDRLYQLSHISSPCMHLLLELNFTKKVLYLFLGYWPQYTVRYKNINHYRMLDFAEHWYLYFIHLIVLLWHFKPPLISDHLPHFQFQAFAFKIPLFPHLFLERPGSLVSPSLLHYLLQETPCRQQWARFWTLQHLCTHRSLHGITFCLLPMLYSDSSCLESQLHSKC